MIDVDSRAEDRRVERDADTKEIFAEFLDDGEESIAQVERLLQEAQKQPSADEELRKMMRTFHTIKGVAGFLDLGEIREVAHVTESLFKEIERNGIAVQGVVADCLYEATALMRVMLLSVREAVATDSRVAAVVGFAELAQKLELAEMLLGLELLKPTAADTGPHAVVSLTGALVKEMVKVEREQLESLSDLTSGLARWKKTLVAAHEEAQRSGHFGGIDAALARVVDFTDRIHSLVSNMRRQQVRLVLQKATRIARELADSTGKKVRIETSGERVQVDRAMIKQIGDPLVHLVRNAVDHGVESPEERETAGKPEEAIVRIAVARRKRAVEVEISDDGRGIDRTKLLARALAQGIVTDEDVADLSDRAIDQLVFHPGLSTAERLTHVSGRGVGMDVVKQSIDAVQGKIEIESRPGRGTIFRLWLPLDPEENRDDEPSDRNIAIGGG